MKTLEYEDFILKKTQFGDWLQCDLIPIEEKRAWWKSQKYRFLSATQAGPWMFNASDRAKGAKQRVFRELIDLSLGRNKTIPFRSFHMERGIALEEQAEAYFSNFLDTQLLKVGLCKSHHGLFCCVPDGLMMRDKSGFEGKAPSKFKHFEYLKNGTLPNQYLYQVHFCMAVTGAESWWFQSWHPEELPLTLKIERSSFTESLFSRAVELSGELLEEMDKEHQIANN
jgi:hypothetical protein